MDDTFFTRIHFYCDIKAFGPFCVFLDLVASHCAANHTRECRYIPPCAIADLITEQTTYNTSGNHTQA